MTPNESLERIQRTFRKRQLVHLSIQGCAIPILVVLFIALIGFTRRLGVTGLSPTAYWISLLALAALGIGTLILYFRNWRCPRCDAYLGGSSNPPHCPECGVKLRNKNRD
jgi:hypothetical protein